jgi:outer membrane protein assembly factor BamB
LAGEFKASPLAAEGRVYFLSTTGDCYVVAADDKYRLLAKSQLDDTFVASLAASDGVLLARGRKHLYCLGKR